MSGRVFFGLGRVFWPLGRVFRVGSGFGSKITARARPVDCCGSKNTARAHPPRSSGRVGSGFFRAGWVGLFGSGDPCPGLVRREWRARDLPPPNPPSPPPSRGNLRAPIPSRPRVDPTGGTSRGARSQGEDRPPSIESTKATQNPKRTSQSALKVTSHQTSVFAAMKLDIIS